MSEAEHRKPCESRGSRTVLGARGGEIPPRDSPLTTERILVAAVANGALRTLLDLQACPAQSRLTLTGSRAPLFDHLVGEHE